VPYDPSTSEVKQKEVNGNQESDWQYPTPGLDDYLLQQFPISRLIFDLQPGSLTVQVAGEHQP